MHSPFSARFLLPSFLLAPFSLAWFAILAASSHQRTLRSSPRAITPDSFINGAYPRLRFTLRKHVRVPTIVYVPPFFEMRGRIIESRWTRTTNHCSHYTPRVLGIAAIISRIWKHQSTRVPRSLTMPTLTAPR